MRGSVVGRRSHESGRGRSSGTLVAIAGTLPSVVGTTSSEQNRTTQSGVCCMWNRLEGVWQPSEEVGAGMAVEVVRDGQPSDFLLD